MTTDITPSGHGRTLHGPLDPAEVLARTRLALHRVPVDRLILSSCGEGPSMLTSSSLRDLLCEGGEEDLVRHLQNVGRRGVPEVHALIVLGDGYQDLLDDVVTDVLGRCGELVLAAAERTDRSLVALTHVQGAAAGRAWRIVLAGLGPQRLGDPPPEDPPPEARDPEARDLEALPLGRRARTALVPLGSLRAFEDTRSAAAAVLAGQRIPRPAPPPTQLEEIGRRLHPAPADLASDADPGLLFAVARAALNPLVTRFETLGEADRVTKCEQVSALLSALAVDRLHWELLAQCVERGTIERIDRETLLQQLVTEPHWQPHEDVCAGGEWYEGLERLRVVAAAATDALAPAHRSTARAAWRALTALLVLLAWWNHRFATAGELVDELWDREPDSSLAPLLSRMIDTPVFPAWWPHR